MFVPFTRIYVTIDKDSFTTKAIVAVSEIAGIEAISEDDGDWEEEYDKGARSVIYRKDGKAACATDDIKALCDWLQFNKTA